MGIIKKFFHNPNPSIVLEKIRLNRPALWSTQKWQYKIQEKTCSQIADPIQLQQLRDVSNENLRRWQVSSLSKPAAVEVTNCDWGLAALKLTRQHGKIYAILNMASSRFVGGGFLDFGTAQEENMWLRTTCSDYINKEFAKGKDKKIDYDESEGAFIYHKDESDLIAGRTKMTEAELVKLSTLRNQPIVSAYKTFLDTSLPQVCFLGSAVFYSPTSEESVPKSGYKISYELSFRPLPKNLIFPFYELRSAAPDPTANSHVDAESEIKRSIEAQLDTLILHGIKHVCLGALGCGCYAMNPEMVATLYREAILKRAQHFEHIAFPILSQAYEDINFDVFSKILNGIPLAERTPSRHYFFKAQDKSFADKQDSVTCLEIFRPN